MAKYILHSVYRHRCWNFFYVDLHGTAVLWCTLAHRLKHGCLCVWNRFLDDIKSIFHIADRLSNSFIATKCNKHEKLKKKLKSNKQLVYYCCDYLVIIRLIPKHQTLFINIYLFIFGLFVFVLYIFAVIVSTTIINIHCYICTRILLIQNSL